MQNATGAVRVETAHHEIGKSLYTLMATIASELLGVPLDRIMVVLGDTALPSASILGGSSTMSSLAQACITLLRQPEGRREVRIDYLPIGAKPDAPDELRAGRIKLLTLPEDRFTWAFGAHLIEVRVHAATGEVRVTRHVDAFAAGRVLNPRATRSQYFGGMA